MGGSHVESKAHEQTKQGNTAASRASAGEEAQTQEARVQEEEEVIEQDTSGDDNLELVVDPMDSEDHEDADGDPEADHDDQDLIEEGSDIFDTDSSAGGDDVDDMRSITGHEAEAAGRALGDLASDVTNGAGGSEADQKPDQSQEELSREEMGGTLVYDSYARLKGCTKIEEYFAANPPQKVATDILFSKTESKEVARELFGEKARERDFMCDQDKHFYKNLPRFQTQRDFSNPQYTLTIPNQQNILIFDSRFENGNLRKVAKVSNVEYNLWLENDLNTKGHTQWYYFKVVYKDIALHADKKNHRVKFNMLNLAKTSSLYQLGMKPCIWSKNKQDEE